MPILLNLLQILIPRRIRNFCRAPIKSLAFGFRWAFYKILKRPSTCRIREDWILNCHPNCYNMFSSYHDVPELRREVEEFISYITPDMTFLDIGSHYGLFTLAAFRYGGPQIKAVAVDPSPDSNRLFHENLRLNHIIQNVYPVQAAVGKSNEKIEMLSTGAFGEFMMVARPKRSDAVSTECFTIPSLIEKFSLDPTHIKIDVEGYETQVLAGGTGFLREHQPILFLEFHLKMMRAQGENPEELLNLLRDLNYKIIWNDQIVRKYETLLAEDIARLVCLGERK